MFNVALYKREMMNSWKLLLIFTTVLAMYVSIMMDMFDPKSAKMLEELAKTMPEIMAAVGMTGSASTLISFMSSYLYGMILIVFPMVFIILRAHTLVAKYTDRGSMVSLLAAPIKRRTVAFTQMKVLGTGIVYLMVFTTLLQIAYSSKYPGELQLSELFLLNVGLLSLHFFIGGICFFSSCAFSDAKYSVGFGAGIPTIMYIMQMLANASENAKNIKYITFFTLFTPDGIIARETSALWGIGILFFGSIVLFISAIIIFEKKDLSI